MGDIKITGDYTAAKFRPMLGAHGLWAGRDLYRATPTATRGLGFFSLPHSFVSYNTQGGVEDLFYLGSSRVLDKQFLLTWIN
jgi:hypothetical protein